MEIIGVAPEAMTVLSGVGLGLFLVGAVITVLGALGSESGVLQTGIGGAVIGAVLFIPGMVVSAVDVHEFRQTNADALSAYYGVPVDTGVVGAAIGEQDEYGETTKHVYRVEVNGQERTLAVQLVDGKLYVYEQNMDLSDQFVRLAPAQ